MYYRRNDASNNKPADKENGNANFVLLSRTTDDTGGFKSFLYAWSSTSGNDHPASLHTVLFPSNP